MCNHYRNDPDQIPSWREYAGYEPGEFSDIKIDVWPGSKAIVLRPDGENRVFEAMTWGFPTREPRKRAPKEGQSPYVISWWTNARTLTASLWKDWIHRPEHRCLVPFNTFAEPKKGQGREEWWFNVNDRPVSAFAGIWKPDFELGNVFAFLTCDANPLVKPLHDKAMPVIVQPEDYEAWLTGDLESACALQQSFPSQLMAVS